MPLLRSMPLSQQLGRGKAFRKRPRRPSRDWQSSTVEATRTILIPAVPRQRLTDDRSGVVQGSKCDTFTKKEACVVNKKSRKQHGVVCACCIYLFWFTVSVLRGAWGEAANGSVTVLGLDSFSLFLFPPKQWVCIHTFEVERAMVASRWIEQNKTI